MWSATLEPALEPHEMVWKEKRGTANLKKDKKWRYQANG
jgi:hypothetical protein